MYQAPAPQPAEKAASKPAAKGATKKGKTAEAAKRDKDAVDAAEDPVAEKLRQQR